MVDVISKMIFFNFLRKKAAAPFSLYVD